MKTIFYHLRKAENGPACQNPSHRAGFTLMEVNIALLIMAVGLLGLFSLFPVGLRQSDAATSDTSEAAFADLVLNAMRSNAQMVTNWSGGATNGWSVLTNGVALGVASSSPASCQVMVPTALNPAPNVKIIADGAAHSIPLSPTSTTDGFLVKGQYIQYALHLEVDPSDSLIVKAWLQVTNRRYTDLTKAPVYATSFAYMGM